MKAKLMNGAVGTKQLEVSIFKFGVHLQDRSALGGVLKRLQSQSTPLSQMLPMQGEGTGWFLIQRFIYVVNIIFSKRNP